MPETPEIGDVVTDKFTNELLTVETIETEGRDTYIRGRFVAKSIGQQTRHVDDIDLT